MTKPDYTLLDLTQAQEIAGDGDQLRELVVVFQTSFADEVTKISVALEKDDAQTVETSLHTLKGFMALFVTPTLALQVGLLYRDCRRQPLSMTKASFNALVPNFQTLSSEVRRWLRL